MTDPDLQWGDRGMSLAGQDKVFPRRWDLQDGTRTTGRTGGEAGRLEDRDMVPAQGRQVAEAAAREGRWDTSNKPRTVCAPLALKPALSRVGVGEEDEPAPGGGHRGCIPIRG